MLRSPTGPIDSLLSKSIEFRYLAELVGITFVISVIPLVYILYFSVLGNLQELILLGLFFAGSVVPTLTFKFLKQDLTETIPYWTAVTVINTLMLIGMVVVIYLLIVFLFGFPSSYYWTR